MFSPILVPSLFYIYIVFSLYVLQIVLESIGISIWQMAVAPTIVPSIDAKGKAQRIENGCTSEKSDVEEESGSECGSDSDEFHEQSEATDRLLAVACDDGCVRLYCISDFNKLTYYRSLPRVSGETSSPLLE